MPIERIAYTTEPYGLYQFKGMRFRNDPVTGEVVWAYPPCVVRYLGTAIDVRTRQPRIIYIGVGGPLDSVWMVTGVLDWATNFTYIGSDDEAGDVQPDPGAPDRTDEESAGPEGR